MLGLEDLEDITVGRVNIEPCQLDVLSKALKRGPSRRLPQPRPGRLCCHYRT